MPQSKAGAQPVDVSFDPKTGAPAGEVVHTSSADVTTIVRRAAAVARSVADSRPHERGNWIHAVAQALLDNCPELAALADEETALGIARLTGELTKAAESARFYASVAAEGSYLDVSIETLLDGSLLSRWNIPVGPVAVFGASNFPFAFGTFGHDVASAIGAGCPVVVKAHPAHPRLTQRLASVVRAALREVGAPVGTFDLVVGFEAGLQVVDAGEIQAIAFTGSEEGGMALVERGLRRGVPVFAEMGTVNPVFVTKAALDQQSQIVDGFVKSFTLGQGQFCTKPGLLLAPAGHGFFDAVVARLSVAAGGALLTNRIARAYEEGIERIGRSVGRKPVIETRSDGGFVVVPAVFRVRLEELKPGSPLLAECFGPVALVVEYENVGQALAALDRLKPSLAASVFVGPDPDPDGSSAIAQLLAQVGRVAVNAWPTGVAAAWSQHHGGPWPATSRPDATSVGAAALRRFVRPVAVQNADASHFSQALEPTNPWNIPRRIHGKFLPST